MRFVVYIDGWKDDRRHAWVRRTVDLVEATDPAEAIVRSDPPYDPRLQRVLAVEEARADPRDVERLRAESWIRTRPS